MEAIVESDTVKGTLKTAAASDYLHLLPLYLEGRLPNDVYSRWEDMELTCPVEPAVFLQQRGLFE